MSEIHMNVVELPTAKTTYSGATPSTQSREMMSQVDAVERPSATQVQETVSRMNEYVQNAQRSLDFRVDDATGQTVIRVYDKTTEELIRQIPGELALQLAQRFNDDEPSLLFRAQV